MAHNVNQPEDLHGFRVVATGQQEMGPVEVVWVDERSRRPQFIGVRPGVLSHRLHLIPLDEAEIDGVRRMIVVPYGKDHVRNTRIYDAQSRLTPNDKWIIRDEYRVERRNLEAESAAEGTDRPSNKVETVDRYHGNVETDTADAIPL